ncbi:MAG: RagB/SusD family nutrient uptake outer membrane protein [Prevotellaceae bacterium]|nr:RagB/SusD family nutrient uptake outer membrane protein [Prevotellaceae bacterium]
MKKILSILTTGALLAMSACTELAEEPHSIITAGDYGTTDAQLETVIGRTYASLRGAGYGDGGNGYIFSEFLFFLSALSSDEAVLPAMNNGADWYDGGRNEEILQHRWTPQNVEILGAWRYAYNGIATANAAIYQLEAAPADDKLKAQLIAEMRTVRAWYYFRLLDWFGNVPLVTDFIDLSLPETRPRAEVYAFVEKELDEIIKSNVLPTTGHSTRITQDAAKCLLARLYLNAEVFSGTPQWQKCLEVCNTIDGRTLTSDYFDNFKPGNGSLPEIIFSIPLPENEWLNPYGYMLLTTKGVQWTQVNKADLEKLGELEVTKENEDGVSVVYKIYEDPYPNYYADAGVICVQPGFYTNTFTDANDKRREAILAGPQYYADGAPIYIVTPTDAYTYIAAPQSGETSPLIYRDGENLKDRQPLEGYCWNKYRLTPDYEWTHIYYGGKPYADFVIFRYAEVLLMKAECLVRLTRAGEAGTALQPIYSRAGASPITSPTLQEIEGEWTREFVLEDQRRTHMIRFGTFTNADHYRGDKTPVTVKDPYTTLFPVPYLELAKNNRLKQNDGY